MPDRRSSARAAQWRRRWGQEARPPRLLNPEDRTAPGRSLTLAAMSPATDLAELDAASVLPLLRSGRLGALEYAEALIRRIESGRGLHALIGFEADAMRTLARRADAIPAAARGTLHGLPLVVKDNIDVAGQPCTAGSPALAGHVPRRPAGCVAALVAAGALPVARANLHEFALGVTSANAAHGAVRTPYAPGRSAGGSSGGTAAALAARMAPVGLGTDTGGSLRIPAAHCGVVGFRPTTGRWPRDGIVPISMPTRDTPGPMARSVADCALLDAVVCGAAPVLPQRPLRGVRLGVPQACWRGLESHLATHAGDVLQRLAGAGVQLVEVDLAVDLDAVAEAGLTIALDENLPALRAYFESHALRFDAERVAAAVASADVRAVFDHLLGNAAPTTAAYRAALAQVGDRLRPALLDCHARYQLDALVMPTTPLPPPRVGEDETARFDGRDWPVFASYTRHTGLASVIGLPSISLPMGLVKIGGERLPVGLQLDALPGVDRELLALAAAVAPLLPATAALRFVQAPR